jgi:hypothetical protein
MTQPLGIRTDVQLRALSAEAAELLIDLRAAHGELLTQLSSMEAVQSLPAPKAEQWAYARWKLSRASRTRRSAATACYTAALAGATPQEADAIRALMAQDVPMMERSRTHMETWTPERITADWAGYCVASRAIRASMHERVVAEQRVLVPILERMAGNALTA